MGVELPLGGVSEPLLLAIALLPLVSVLNDKWRLTIGAAELNVDGEAESRLLLLLLVDRGG